MPTIQSKLSRNTVTTSTNICKKQSIYKHNELPYNIEVAFVRNLLLYTAQCLETPVELIDRLYLFTSYLLIPYVLQFKALILTQIDS